MNIFNNREIATAIWLLVIFILMLVIREVRKSLSDLVKAFFKMEILLLVFLMVTYNIGILIILNLLDLWNISLLKDFVIWFCFTAFLMIYNAITSTKNENLLRKLIIDNIKIVIIFEFFVNTYTFSLVGELVLIPIVTIIVISEVIAKTDKKYNSVVKLMRGLQIIIGTGILIYAVSKAISDYKNFGSLETLRNFLLAPMLTISLLPFIYFAVLFSTYELLLIQLNLGFEKSKALKCYAKRKTIRYFQLNLSKLKKALNVNTFNLMHIRNKKDVDEMIKSYKSEESSNRIVNFG